MHSDLTDALIALQNQASLLAVFPDKRLTKLGPQVERIAKKRDRH